LAIFFLKGKELKSKENESIDSKTNPMSMFEEPKQKLQPCSFLFL